MSNYFDIYKVLSFMDDITVDKTSFRKNVLLSFQKFFDYERSDFWLCDKNGNLIEPITLNIDHSEINDYLINYKHLDFLAPKNKEFQLQRKRVYRIHDIIPKEKYENSEYYTEFMSKYGYYHNMALFLYDGRSLLGLINFTRSKAEKPFKDDDVNKLEIISRFLTEKTTNLFNYKSTPQPSTVDKSENSLQLNSLITDKEKEVLTLVQKGYTNREIAKEIFISVNTVKKRLQSIYSKLGVNNRTSLSYKLISNGILYTDKNYQLSSKDT